LSDIRGQNGGNDENGQNQDDPQAEEGGDEDLPEELTSQVISRTIRRYSRRLGECRSQSSLPAGEVLEVDVEMTIQGDGSVSSARAGSSDDAAQCIVGIVRDMEFPRFSGSSQSFTYPFRVR
jgi:hypothetical protein